MKKYLYIILFLLSFSLSLSGQNVFKNPYFRGTITFQSVTGINQINQPIGLINSSTLGIVTVSGGGSQNEGLWYNWIQVLSENSPGFFPFASISPTNYRMNFFQDSSIVRVLFTGTLSVTGAGNGKTLRLMAYDENLDQDFSLATLINGITISGTSQFTVDVWITRLSNFSVYLDYTVVIKDNTTLNGGSTGNPRVAVSSVQVNTSGLIDFDYPTIFYFDATALTDGQVIGRSGKIFRYPNRSVPASF